jgi:hypothetical protein
MIVDEVRNEVVGGRDFGKSPSFLGKNYTGKLHTWDFVSFYCPSVAYCGP